MLRIWCSFRWAALVCCTIFSSQAIKLQAQTAEHAALAATANKIADLMSWRAAPEALGSMTDQALAEYCLQQLKVIRQPEGYFAAPVEVPELQTIRAKERSCSGMQAPKVVKHIPNLEAASNLFKKYGVSAPELADPTKGNSQIKTGLSGAEHIATMKADEDRWQAESKKLAQTLPAKELLGLATELHDTLAVVEPKPSWFKVSSIDVQGATAQAALQLCTSAGDVTDHGSSAVRANFALEANQWKFNGLSSPIAPANVDWSKAYISWELRGFDLNNPASEWSFSRTRHSRNFILWFNKGYGGFSPSAPEVPEQFRVDVVDLLRKAEQFYYTNVTRLQMANLGAGSQLNNYKINIFLFYTTDWMAFGGGADNVVGSLWISPSTCKPVGSTIAHEVGHSFQYQVYCDLQGDSGFRWGFGSGGGNGFWETSAQYQAFQNYPGEAISGYHMPDFYRAAHRHWLHEWQRYSNASLLYYWRQRRGSNVLSRIWRETVRSEDPIQTYMRLYGLSFSQFNDEYFEAARRHATWDINILRGYANSQWGSFRYQFDFADNGFVRVAYSRCPGTTGMNIIELAVPAAGQSVTVDFQGLPNQPGYNPMPEGVQPGWRYGFVAQNAWGGRSYSPRYRDQTRTVGYRPPADTQRLWLVVTGAPESYRQHTWDENEGNDEQWPYQIRLRNTYITNAD